MKAIISHLQGGIVSFSICLLFFLALLCGDSDCASNATGKKCGQVTCGQFEFCSEHLFQCSPCSGICDPTSNNRQVDDCDTLCKDYKEAIMSSPLERKIQQAITLSCVAIAVSCLVLVLIVGYLLANHVIKKGIWQKSKKKKQLAEKIDVEASRTGLKLDMSSAQAQVPAPPRSVSPSQCPVTPVTTSTPLSRPRHPSEDATLEYAYDNPALAPTPVLDKDVSREPPGRKESSF